MLYGEEAFDVFVGAALSDPLGSLLLPQKEYRRTPSLVGKNEFRRDVRFRALGRTTDVSEGSGRGRLGIHYFEVSN